MNRAEKVAAVIVVVTGVLIAAYSYYALKLGMTISPGAGFMPFLIGVALIILGLLLFIQKHVQRPVKPSPALQESDVERQEDKEAATGFSRKMLLGIAVAIAYALLFERVGYFLATLAFMLGWQIIVEREKWLKSVVITVLSTAVMYTLFNYLLNIHLPKGDWF